MYNACNFDKVWERGTICGRIETNREGMWSVRNVKGWQQQRLDIYLLVGQQRMSSSFDFSLCRARVFFRSASQNLHIDICTTPDLFFLMST